MHNKKLENKTKTKDENKNKNTSPCKRVKNNQISTFVNNEIKLSPKYKQEIDFVRENKLTEVIALQSKGLNQSEIATKIGVNQSTISRDLQYLKQEGKHQIWQYLNDEILFEYLRFIVENNEISKKLWEIVQNENTSTKEKTNALSLLNQIYTKRLEILMNGPKSFKDVKKSFSEIKDLEMMKRNPMLKLSSKLGQLPNPFSKR